VEEALRRCPAGQVVAARDGGVEVAVCVLEDGRAFALPDLCPHDGGRLSDGFVEAGRLVCGRHGWEFDPATGRRVGRSN
jgi:nitrite reductase/ring-hydroxylating ferredoxin subunit